MKEHTAFCTSCDWERDVDMLFDLTKGKREPVCPRCGSEVLFRANKGIVRVHRRDEDPAARPAGPDHTS